MPTGIWSSRWRSGCAHWDLDCEEETAGEEAEEAERRRRRRRTALIKSNNPHLAGGEKMSEDMPDRMSKRMSEDMPERMS